jgi:hypothetical protein
VTDGAVAADHHVRTDGGAAHAVHREPLADAGGRVDRGGGDHLAEGEDHQRGMSVAAVPEAVGDPVEAGRQPVQPGGSSALALPGSTLALPA